MLVDTSVLLAATNWRDPGHTASAAVLADNEWILPEPVLVEVDHMLRSRSIDRTAFLTLIQTIESGQVDLAGLTADDYTRVRELYGQYPQMDFVDTAIVALAERLKETTIATLDHRDFRIVRPKHIPAFTLVP